MSKPKKIKLYTNYPKEECPDELNDLSIGDNVKLMTPSGKKIWVEVSKIVTLGRYHGSVPNGDVYIFEASNIFDWNNGYGGNKPIKWYWSGDQEFDKFVKITERETLPHDEDFWGPFETFGKAKENAIAFYQADILNARGAIQDIRMCRAKDSEGEK